MERYDQGFPSRLQGLTMETLENTPDPVYAMDHEFRLCYFNPAWTRFARENNGEPDISRRFGLGANVADTLPPLLKDFYLGMFRHVMQAGQVMQHTYECSSAKVFRLYHQSIYPLREESGVVVVNCLVEEEPQRRPGVKTTQKLTERYSDTNGLITQCSHCRRTKDPKNEGRWEWVPSFVERMPANTSHGLCPLCFDYYYLRR